MDYVWYEYCPEKNVWLKKFHIIHAITLEVAKR